jgi:hypothetical protein
MKVDKVGEEVIPIPFIGIVAVKERVPEDITVLGVLETVKLIK